MDKSSQLMIFYFFSLTLIDLFGQIDKLLDLLRYSFRIRLHLVFNGIPLRFC